MIEKTLRSQLEQRENQTVGESKRRKETLGEQYGKEPNIAPWLPFTKTQADRFTKITTTGAWTGIILLVVAWLTIRFIGPTVGWWTVN